ncbi:MAG TPA: SRPBCC family protein [Methyloceanibacter sp.]|nr:SRPBCC family protein [Methyloceanibacter sp.]
MLKDILIALVLIIAAFLVVVAAQPSEFRVERTTTMAAPADVVFTQVNDLHKWDAWSPWAKLDPDAKVTFAGPDAGKDAAMSWSGNDKVGEGKMTIVESHPNDAIKIEVDFTKPFEGSIGSEFGFKPNGNKTDVSWAMTGHRTFVQKAFCLVMNGDKMLSGDIEKGLAQLKSVAEQGKS